MYSLCDPTLIRVNMTGCFCVRIQSRESLITGRGFSLHSSFRFFAQNRYLTEDYDGINSLSRCPYALPSPDPRRHLLGW